MSKNKLIRLLAAQKSETGLDGEEYYQNVWNEI